MSYKQTIFKDPLMHIQSDDNSFSYHEVEIESQMDGELESVTINRNTGKILIRFKNDDRDKSFDTSGDYIKPLNKDKDFKINIIESYSEI